MFGIENSLDRLTQLKENFENLKKDALNVSLAEQACSDAWHLVDWVYDEKKQKDQELTSQVFRTRIYQECPEMKILHDLVNSFKHKQLDRPKVKIVETKKHVGNFGSDFSKDFNISRLEVHFEDQSKIDVDELIQIAIKYWDQVIIQP